MLIYELIACRCKRRNGDSFSLAATSFCQTLRYTAGQLAEEPDIDFLEWEAYDPLSPKRTFDPECRIPFWSAHQGLLRSQWPEWFREAFDDHCDECDLFHRFPSRISNTDPPRFN